MAILHTATRVSDFTNFNPVTSNAVNTTSGTYIDTNYVTHGIIQNDPANNSMLARIDTAEPATTYWAHFSYVNDIYEAPSTFDGEILNIYDSSSNLIYKWDLVDGNSLHTVYGDTTDSSFALQNSISTGGAVWQFDVSITVDASNIAVEVFVNEVSQGSTTVSNTVSGYGKPTRLEIVLDDASIFSGHYFVISEVIVADESTIGMRLAELSLDTIGDYNQFTGSLTSLFDNDDQTFLVSDTDGNRTSATLSAFGGTTAGYEIAEVRMVSEALKTDVSSVSTLKHFARIASTDYDNATAHTIDLGKKVVQSGWTTNPNTASAWTFSDLTTVQLGLKTET